MIPARARRLAEACFALARSTTHAGERENALGRGQAICAKHGLDLDDFDIPGRMRRPRPARSGPSGGRASFGADFSTSEDFEVWSAHLRERAARWSYGRPEPRSRPSDPFEEAMRATAARPGETPFDARRRNFDEACAAAKERDAARDRRRRARAAADHLWHRGIEVFETNGGTWFVVFETNGGSWFLVDGAHGRELDDEALIDLAEKMRDEGVPA